MIGPGAAEPADVERAEAVGSAVGEAEAVLVCGGLGGVMEAACRGASVAGGLTVGLLPGDAREAANHWVQVAIPTGLGEGRNLLVVRAASAVIAIGGGWGTLSEIALAMRAGKPVIGLKTWTPTPPSGVQPVVIAAEDARSAVRAALEAISTA